MDGSDVDIGHIHGYLSNTIFLYIPADSLAALQGTGNPDHIAVLILHHLSGDRVALSLLAALLADVEGHGVGTAGGGGVEVIVDGHEEIPGAHCSSTCTCGKVVDNGRTEIGLLPVGESLGQALVLACAAYGQIPACLGIGSALIAEYRDSQLLAYPLGQGESRLQWAREGTRRWHPCGDARRDGVSCQ